MKCFHSYLTYRKSLSFLLLPLIVALALNLAPNFSVHEKQVSDTSTLEAQYAQLPLAFEPNQGQVNDAVQYLVHHGQATTFFTGTDTVTSIGDEYITMSLNGANQPSFVGTDELPSKTNYFIGNDQSKWRSDVPNFEGIIAKNVYPGIDLKFYGTNSQLEHDFIVAPGTNPKQIAFNFAGQEHLKLDPGGNLLLMVGEQGLSLQAPVSFQEMPDGTRNAVDSSFQVSDNDSIRIVLGDYDQNKTLIIDPVLVYSTYLGGTGDDNGFGVAVDPNGNTYVTGQTDSTNFPTSTPFQAANGGGTTDVFVSKFNPAGTALVYSTYLGGSGLDLGASIATDLAGNAYVTGQTDSSNFPTSSPYQASYAGLIDTFVAKLNAAGSALTYSTYLGGATWSDIGTGIAVDPSGNAYVTGYTGSTDYPTSSPFQASFGGGSSDAFLTKFNPAGSALTYSTYFGGSANDSGRAIAVDNSNLAYITGTTDSTNFPTSAPFQGSVGGNTDAFAAKFAASGATLVYSTYLGGSIDDLGYGIAADSSGNAYVVGWTDSSNYPTSAPYQGVKSTGQDAFVTMLNAAGSALTYSTFLGGNATDFARGIAVNASGNAYVTGETNSTNFPVANAYQATSGGGNEAFVTKFAVSGATLDYSTYLGGGGNGPGVGIALSLGGNAYVAGYTNSTTFPTFSAFQGANAGSYDAFLAQLSEHTVVVSGTIQPALTFSIGSTTCNMGVFSASQTQFCTHTISAGSNATNGYVISYIPTTTLTSGANTITAMASQTASVLASEQFGFNLKANTAAGSFTATDFGADASGGTGTAMTGYELANQFKFDVAGDDIAQTTGASNSTTFTASFIANITAITEAGLYATPVTYNIVASY